MFTMKNFLLFICLSLVVDVVCAQDYITVVVDNGSNEQTYRYRISAGDTLGYVVFPDTTKSRNDKSKDIFYHRNANVSYDYEYPKKSSGREITMINNVRRGLNYYSAYGTEVASNWYVYVCSANDWEDMVPDEIDGYDLDGGEKFLFRYSTYSGLEKPSC